MTVKEYVDEVLCAPVTRIGTRYIVEAIELVLDTHDIKFYPRLSQILQCPTSRLEKGIRDARSLSLRYMSDTDREQIFGEEAPSNSQYILRAAEYYRRNYENKE